LNNHFTGNIVCDVGTDSLSTIDVRRQLDTICLNDNKLGRYIWQWTRCEIHRITLEIVIVPDSFGTRPRIPKKIWC